MKTSAKILIVDDLLSMRVVVKNAFKELGFSDFEEAGDGVKAFEMVRSKSMGGSPFDLVVSDWDMPNMNGMELLKKIKSDQWCQKTPFLFVSTDVPKEEKIKALQAGAVNYVVRPFKPEHLQIVVDQIREDKRKIKE